MFVCVRAWVRACVVMLYAFVWKLRDWCGWSLCVSVCWSCCLCSQCIWELVRQNRSVLLLGQMKLMAGCALLNEQHPRRERKQGKITGECGKKQSNSRSCWTGCTKWTKILMVRWIVQSISGAMNDCIYCNFPFFKRLNAHYIWCRRILSLSVFVSVSVWLHPSVCIWWSLHLLVIYRLVGFHLPVHLSVSFCLRVCLLSLSLPVFCLYICQPTSVCLPVFLFLRHLSVYLSACLSVSLSVCICCLSITLSVCQYTVNWCVLVCLTTFVSEITHVVRIVSMRLLCYLF